MASTVSTNYFVFALACLILVVGFNLISGENRCMACKAPVIRMDGLREPFADNRGSGGSGRSGLDGVSSHTVDMLSDQEFRPNCCPATYSSSGGCACMPPNTQSALDTRGNNRTTGKW
jgi:hypothetical protein